MNRNMFRNMFSLEIFEQNYAISSKQNEKNLNFGTVWSLELRPSPYALRPTPFASPDDYALRVPR